jgi:hypothetical protein
MKKLEMSKQLPGSRKSISLIEAGIYCTDTINPGIKKGSRYDIFYEDITQEIWLKPAKTGRKASILPGGLIITAHGLSELIPAKRYYQITKGKLIFK